MSKKSPDLVQIKIRIADQFLLPIECAYFCKEVFKIIDSDNLDPIEVGLKLLEWCEANRNLIIAEEVVYQA